MEFITASISEWGYVALFIAMALENANIPIPSEVILGFAGYLISQGVFTIHETIIWATLAGIVGSVISYWIGSYGGRPLLMRYGRYIFFNEKKFTMAENLFNRYGGLAVFVGRLLPGVRTFISFPAGVANYPMSRFLLWTFVGTIPWTVLLVYMGVILGKHWQELTKYNHEFLLVVVAIFLIALIVWAVRRKIKTKS